MRHIRNTSLGLVLALAAPLLLVSGLPGSRPGTAAAQDANSASPDATFRIYGEKPSGPGQYMGQGTLTYQGKEHPFTIEGMSASGVDSNHPVEGSVSNLKQLSDLDGHYTVAKHEREGGMDVLHLQNDKGVGAVARGTNEGIALGAQASGITVALGQ